MIVIKLGGCNGSGKTSVIRALLESTSFKFEVVDNRRKSFTYGTGNLPKALQDAGFKYATVLGSYVNVCGGMDTISDKEDRNRLILANSQPNTLLVFEGLITGKTYGRIGEISESAGHQGRWIYAYMDTPYEECVRRVMLRRAERRAAKGIDSQVDDFDPERTMRPTYKACVSTARKAEEQGHRVVHLDHTKKPHELAKKLIAEAAKLAKKSNT